MNGGLPFLNFAEHISKPTSVDRNSHTYNFLSVGSTYHKPDVIPLSIEDCRVSATENNHFKAHAISYVLQYIK